MRHTCDIRRRRRLRLGMGHAAAEAQCFLADCYRPLTRNRHNNIMRSPGLPFSLGRAPNFACVSGRNSDPAGGYDQRQQGRFIPIAQTMADAQLAPAGERTEASRGARDGL